jgi:hypothetical protein
LVVASDDKMTDCSNVQRNEKKNDTAGERRSFCARISFRLVSVDARESLFFLPRYATYLSSCKVRSATYAHKYSSRTPPPSLSLTHTHVQARTRSFFLIRRLIPELLVPRPLQRFLSLFPQPLRYITYYADISYYYALIALRRASPDKCSRARARMFTRIHRRRRITQNDRTLLNISAVLSR